MSAAVFVPSEQDLKIGAVFEALMWAMSRPGSVQELPVAAIEEVAAALLDAETLFFASDSVLSAALSRTGARQSSAEAADYLFVSLAEPSEVEAASAAKPGSLLYPDSSATLFVPALLGRGQRLALSGPGINGGLEILVGGIDPSFWQLRATHTYPLGWDLYLMDQDRLIGIPRSTAVEVLP